MATPSDVVWERDRHTAAKHTLLRRYMEAWFPIMATQFRKQGITFFDGFAGPGEYTNALDSSPLIALRQAFRTEVKSTGAPVRIVLVEQDPRRVANLERVLMGQFPPAARPPSLNLAVHSGRCGSVFEAAIAAVGGWAGPVFANLDGWGVDTDYEVARRIAAHRSSEVLVTFQDQFFIRFAEGDQESGERVFGDNSWRAVADLPTGRKRRFLLELYRQRLHDAGFSYVLTFEMLDEGGHAIHQFFGTNHEVAVRKFKDALWVVDGVSGQRFRDPRDPDQLAFDLALLDLTPLKNAVLERLREQPRSIAQLRNYALLETIYKEAHLPDAVAELQNEWRVTVSPGRSYESKVVSIADRLFPTDL